jgi:hypothetical protein
VPVVARESIRKILTRDSQLVRVVITAPTAALARNPAVHILLSKDRNLPDARERQMVTHGLAEQLYHAALDTSLRHALSAGNPLPRILPLAPTRR